MKHLKFTYILCLVLLALSSCRKFVELPVPDDRLTASTVYSTNEVATSVINGIYIRTSETFNVVSKYSTEYLGFTSDELTDYYTNAVSESYLMYQNNANSNTEFYWSGTYKLIYYCNVAIEGIEGSSALDPNLKTQLLGESKFMRALFYYYLVNSYGKVPLITKSDYSVNINAKRAEVSDIYAQIIADLKDAQSKLSKDYLNGDALTPYTATSAERVRPTYWAATALLARIYLYTKQWNEAEANATILINNNMMFSLPPAARVFQKNSQESIFQLPPVLSFSNSLFNARTFVLGTAVGTLTNPGAISPQLQQAFEPDDQRKTNWTGTTVIGGKTYVFPYKYKANTPSLSANKPEYLTILRLAEQYLIRAEARAQLNNLGGAADDVNAIRTRAGLPNTTITNQTALLDAVMQERRIELFCEQGHRWFDLKRTGRVDAVMSVVTPTKGGTWQSYKQFIPIPADELANGPGLDQNPGYN
jgi:hypothetical protein